jgi:hypothetical protein
MALSNRPGFDGTTAEERVGIYFTFILLGKSVKNNFLFSIPA